MAAGFLILILGITLLFAEEGTPRPAASASLFKVDVDTDPSFTKVSRRNELAFPMANALGLQSKKPIVGQRSLLPVHAPFTNAPMENGLTFDQTVDSILGDDEKKTNWQKIGSETPGLNLMMNVLKDGGVMLYGKGNDVQDNEGSSGWSLLEMKATVLKPLNSAEKMKNGVI